MPKVEVVTIWVVGIHAVSRPVSSGGIKLSHVVNVDTADVRAAACRGTGRGREGHQYPKDQKRTHCHGLSPVRGRGIRCDASPEHLVAMRHDKNELFNYNSVAIGLAPFRA